MAGLAYTIRTGAAAYEAVHGDNLWNDLESAAGELDGTSELQFSDRLLESHTHLHGLLVDLERPARVAKNRFRRAGFDGRAKAVTGSFFEPLPPGADVYLLSAILADCLRILRRCAEAAGPGGRVLVAEVHMSPPGLPDPVSETRSALWIEASMEHPDRTVADLEAIARSAGFAVESSGPNTGSRSFLVLGPQGWQANS